MRSIPIIELKARNYTNVKVKSNICQIMVKLVLKYMYN